MNWLAQFTGILANLSFFGGFVLTLYGLRKPKTRAHVAKALARMAGAVEE